MIRFMVMKDREWWEGKLDKSGQKVQTSFIREYREYNINSITILNTAV